MLQSQVNIDTTIDLRGIKINLISVKFIGKSGGVSPQANAAGQNLKDIYNIAGII